MSEPKLPARNRQVYTWHVVFTYKHGRLLHFEDTTIVVASKRKTAATRTKLIAAIKRDHLKPGWGYEALVAFERLDYD